MPRQPKPTNLIIVCCHAVFGAEPTAVPKPDPYDEDNWALKPFQVSTGTKPGEQETFLQHICMAIDMCFRGSWAHNSLIIFSGGPTARDLTDKSEARGYYDAASCLDTGLELAFLTSQNKVVVEEKATDSYQNLLFSILEFKKATGQYPEQIRVVTHAFKAKRFLTLHAAAIHWPPERIRVQGVDPVMSTAEFADIFHGEEKRGLQPWRNDPHGAKAPLSEKRKERGWTDTALNDMKGKYGAEVDELLGLQTAAGSTTLSAALPWESMKAEDLEAERERAIQRAEDAEKYYFKWCAVVEKPTIMS